MSWEGGFSGPGLDGGGNQKTGPIKKVRDRERKNYVLVDEREKERKSERKRKKEEVRERERERREGVSE